MTNVVGLIAKREITTRLQQRGYRIALAITLLLVVLACVVPSFFGGDDGPDTYDVGIAAGPAQLPALLEGAVQGKDVRLKVHRTDPDTARAKVRDGDWDAAIVPGDRLVVEKSGDAVVNVLQDAHRFAATVDGLRRAHIPDSQIRRALDVKPLTVSSTEPSQHAARVTLAIITIVFLFSQLITFCTWVAMGVVEEKSSRVVELVLASVRPHQLLAGKLLGIGALAAGQVLALGVAALVSASASGTLSVPVSGLLTVVTGFVGFVLGFCFFGALAAGLASTVSRQEEVGPVLAPVTLTLMVCYGAAFGIAFDGTSTFARVLSIVPPVSCIAMPGRIAHGNVPVTDLVLAVVLLLLTATGIVAVAARVYRAAVLHSGTRVSLRRAWHAEAVADIA